MSPRVRDRRGRDERRDGAIGRVQAPDLRDVYGRELTAVSPGREQFEVLLARSGTRSDPLDLTALSESLRWAEEAGPMTGAVSLRRPPDGLPVGLGQQLVLRERTEIWRMRLAEPQPGEVTEVELADDLDALRRNRREWEFRSTGRRRKGWLPGEIAREVFRREGIRPGRVVMGTARIGRIVREAPGLDVLRDAYRRERERTGQRFVIRLRAGRGEVVPLARGRILHVIERTLAEPTIEVTRKGKPITVIEAEGRVRSGKRTREIRVTVRRAAAERRFGLRRVERDFGRVSSLTDLRERATIALARELEVKRTATLLLPGLPRLRRGDAVRWLTDEPGWRGPDLRSAERSFAWVTQISHELSSVLTTEATISQADPFLADLVRRDREARDRGARRRGDR